MKKTLLLVTLSLFISMNTYAQDGCSKYYPMVEGASFEYTNYSKKGEIDGVTSHNISSVTSEGTTTKVTIDFKMSDKKGKELFTSNYGFTCEDNIVKIDY
jgi:hypothetical protein